MRRGGGRTRIYFITNVFIVCETPPSALIHLRPLAFFSLRSREEVVLLPVGKISCLTLRALTETDGKTDVATNLDLPCELENHVVYDDVDMGQQPDPFANHLQQVHFHCPWRRSTALIWLKKLTDDRK